MPNKPVSRLSPSARLDYRSLHSIFLSLLTSLCSFFLSALMEVEMVHAGVNRWLNCSPHVSSNPSGMSVIFNLLSNVCFTLTEAF